MRIAAFIYLMEYATGYIQGQNLWLCICVFRWGMFHLPQ